MNELTLQIYSTGTTPIFDIGAELLDGEGLYIESGYATGSLAGGMFVPRDPRRWWEVKGTLRAVVRNGTKIVYEGWIPDLLDRFSETAYGKQINFTGGFGWFLMNRAMRKRWSDNRVDQQNWAWQNGTSGADLCTVQRDARLYFTPKTELWTATYYYALRYTMPTGNINRITFDYDFTEEAGQDWTVSLYDVDNASTEWSQSATTVAGPLSVDLDSTNDFTPTQNFEFRITSNANQTPSASGATNLKITNLIVYGEDETGAGISLNTVAADIITANSDILNSETAYLEATNLRTVEPFITSGDNYESLADILTNIAGFGDTNDGQYAVGVLDSERATTPNGLPVLFTADWPDVDAGFDLFLSPNDDRIQGDLTLRRNYDSIANYIVVSYLDASNLRQYVTPADDATLTDATSVSDYGTRYAPGGALNLGNSTQQNAIDFGVRYLNKYKDPIWVVDNAITMLGSIDDDSGQPIAASLLVGKVPNGLRLKVDGYDTFVVSRARYDHDSRTVALTVGPLLDLIFTESVFEQTWNDLIPTGDDTSGANVVKQPWWKIQDKIGKRGRKKLKAEGKWQEYKRENAPWAK